MRHRAVPLLVLPRLMDALLWAGSAMLEGPLRLRSNMRQLMLPADGGTVGLSSSCRLDWLPSTQVSRQSLNRAKQKLPDLSRSRLWDSHNARAAYVTPSE